MKSLFMDTTGQKMRITYIEDGRMVRDFVGSDGFNQSAEIFGAIANVLGDVRVADLDFVVVLGGPGSFTGIRLGLSVAKGFHLATGIPVLVVNNFVATVYSLDDAEKTKLHDFYVCLNAGVNDVYVAKVGAGGADVEAGRIVKRAEFVADLPVVSDIVVEPVRVVSTVAKSFDKADFVQGEIEPTYIKPHYAKVKTKHKLNSTTVLVSDCVRP